MRMKRTKGFTLVELMVVVLIVAILAAVAITLMKGRIDAAKCSEAKAGIGTLASALRTYAADNPNFAATPTKAQISVLATDLNGTYFDDPAYQIVSASCNNGVLSYVITATAANSTRANPPTNPAKVTLTVVAGGAATWSQT